MKKIGLIFIIIMLLTACNIAPEEISISELSLENADEDVKEFVDNRESDEDGIGNGIYLFFESEKTYYLCLSKEFLNSSDDFGNIAIKNSDSALSIYLKEEVVANGKPGEYKLYEINMDKSYDTIKVYKNNQETYFETIGG